MTDATTSTTSGDDYVDNRLFLWAEITRQSGLTLMQDLLLKDRNLRAEAAILGVEPRPIYLHLNSNGGDADASLALYDAILGLESDVVGIVDGLAASGASIILQACDERLVRPRSVMLIHQLRAMTWGTMSEIEDHNKLLRVYTNHLVDIYCEKTGLGRRRMRELLGRDTYMSAIEAVDQKFADQVLV